MPLRMRVDGFADGGTHISTHNRAKTDHLYIRTKNKDKCHCACVWTGLQMVGHIYRTTIALRLLSCILRFIHKGKTPLRMRVDGFADGGTHISHHNRAKTAIVYITLRSMQKQGQNALVDGFADGGTHISTHNRAKTDHLYIRTKNKDKCHCACVWTGLQMVGHIYRTTIVLIVLSCILRFIRGKTYAIAHACGRVCRWWDTYLQPHSYFVLHVFVSFPRKPLFVCLTFRESLLHIQLFVYINHCLA